jgi:RpiR family carbohydrate utilization transcriptional regulator
MGENLKMIEKMRNDKNGLDEIEYLARIRNHYNLLSDSERKIADYIINQRETILKLTVAELAEKIGSSAATIVRFCRSVGFKGYTELKFYIERELLSLVGAEEKIDKNDSVKVLKQKVFKFNQKIIDDTIMTLDDENLEKAIIAITNARKVDIYGEGGSGSIALTALNILLHIGISCNAHTDANLQILSALQLQKGDVAIGISHSGRTINAIDALKVAKQNGATTICITGYAKSAITQYSDVVLYSSSKTSRFLSDLPAARISELCVLSAIQLGIVVQNYDGFIENVKKTKEIVEIKRVK